MFSRKRAKKEWQSHEDRITCSRWWGKWETLLNFNEILGGGVLCYSVCFLLVSAAVFCWFWAAKRTFIWRSDGWIQQYKTLVYWGRYLRSLLKNLLVDNSFSVPEWDFALGEGGDILTTFQCHVIGDPLCLLAVFVPAKYMWVLFGSLNLIRMYLSGFFFILLSRRTSQRNGNGILAGALTYAFCGWAVVHATRQQIYLMPMMYLPMFLLGVEEQIRKKRSSLLTIAVFLAAISNFYFFYVLVCITVIYVTVRLFTLYRADLRRAWKPLLRIAGASVTGVLLSAAIVLPVVRTYVGSSRASIQNGVRLFYSLGHYSQIPGMFISSAQSNTLRMGYSITVIPALFLLFRKKGQYQYKILKIFFAISMAVVALPFLGQALHGFSYITNRWCFALALLMSYILTAVWDDLMALSRRDIRFLLMCSIAYFVVCLLLDYSRTEEVMASLALLFILLCMLICMSNSMCAGENADGFERVNRDGFARHRQTITVGITVFSIVMHSFEIYASGADGQAIEERVSIRETENLLQTEAHVVKKIAENELQGEPYRYAGSDITTNANILAGVSSTDWYWSIANPYMVEFRTLLDAGENSPFYYSGYDNNAALTALAGVRYYTALSDGAQAVPYGFSYMNAFDIREESTAAAMEAMRKELGAEELSDSHKQSISDETAIYYSVYENEYTLPLAYTYDNAVSYDTWSRLNRVEKQEALLQTVVLQQTEGLPETQILPDSRSLKFKISCNSNEITQKGNSFVVTKPGASITLSFEGMADSETYVLVDGLHYKDISEYELYFGKLEDDPLDLYNKTRWNLLSHEKRQEIFRNHLFSNDSTVYMNIAMKSSEGAIKTLEYTTPFYMMYCGRHDFTTNLGYAQEPVTNITISFPHIGTYSYDSIEVVCQPMENYSKRIDALRHCTLENMKMENDTITGTIHADQDKWLCLAVPYSPGWRAWLDGAETVLHRANVQYMALRIPAGDHSVRLVYETPLLRIGVCISAVTAAMCLLFTVAANYRKKRKNNIK